MIIAKEYTIVCDKCGYSHEYRFLYSKVRKQKSLDEILTLARLQFKHCKETDKILCNKCYREYERHCAEFFKQEPSVEVEDV